MEQKELKNTRPAVSSDVDSLGREHNRSEDGEFTAGNKYFDDNFSVPYFESVVKPYLLSSFYPGLDMKQGTDLDEDKGIDYIVLDEEGKPFETFDLKTVTDALGGDISDEETPFSLNLYKMDKGNRNWLEGSHLNTRHINDGYVFLFIDTFDDKNQIEKQLKSGATFDQLQDVYGFKAFCVPKEDFDQYINDHLLNLPHVQDLIKNQKQYLGYPEEHFPEDAFPKGTKFKTNKKGNVEYISYRVPLPGEQGIIAEIKAYRQKDGVLAIRAFIPNKVFSQTSLKDIVKTIEADRN